MEKVRSFEVVLPLLALGGVALWINYYYRKRPTISGGQQEAAESNYFPTETKMFRNLRTLSLILMIMDGSFEFEMVKLSPILGACPLLQYLSFVVSRHWRAKDERGSRRAPLSRTCHTELKQVTFNGFAGTESEMEFVLYIMRSAIVLEQMFLSPRYKYSRFVPREDSIASLDQRKRNSIKQKLHGQAISRKAVVIIQ